LACNLQSAICNLQPVARGIAGHAVSQARLNVDAATPDLDGLVALAPYSWQFRCWQLDLVIRLAAEKTRHRLPIAVTVAPLDDRYGSYLLNQA